MEVCYKRIKSATKEKENGSKRDVVEIVWDRDVYTERQIAVMCISIMLTLSFVKQVILLCLEAVSYVISHLVYNHLLFPALILFSFSKAG